ncbi:uncharacterized protein LOC134696851 [Mytilus trossulus]|uniref:uncharacterized protein LOC134696851 n=1 Tax=Mytilus trossulus TaxID=6551 RepID=UPI0030042672
MDAELQEQIRIQVSNILTVNQNDMMNQMRSIISSEMGKMHVQQQQLAETQVSKIEATLTDGPKFKKRGNEEQFKQNVKVLSKMKEADSILDSNNPTPDTVCKAKEKLAEGISLMNYRQKLIRIADSSKLGWRVVNEYETNPLADDSEDERKLYKAENRAERKVKADKTKKARRVHPYVQPAEQAVTSMTRKPGRCFNCGVKGHWKQECPEKQQRKNDKISNINTLYRNNIEVHVDDLRTKVDTIKSPVNSLRKHINKWKIIQASDYILNVIEKGYMLPLKTLPENVLLDNNRSAKENKSFVTVEIEKLVSKGCISEVFVQPKVVNPLTVAGNKSKLRLVLDCRHINPHLYQFSYKYEDATVARKLFSEGDYLFSFDLKSAYHHILVQQEDRTYLGFQWESKFYIFNVLCFGLATAGFIFSKVLRELIKYWRSNSIRILMYLDDGLGGADTYDECTKVSH